MTALEMTFAPLLVQEVVAGEGGDPNPFGAWVTVDRSRARIDSERPTLYATAVTKGIDGTDHEQVVYIWRYPASDGARRCISREGRGVRITLGLDGFPLVWEVLSTDARTTVLFVAESLEQAARRQFGDPLLGRRFAVERAADETPDVVVARIIDDGPVPMGPYVYLNAPPDRAVTTVLCRCSPSQVEEFIQTQYYDLVPLETIDGGTSGRMRWAGTLVYEELLRPNPNKSLDRVLRWPKM